MATQTPPAEAKKKADPRPYGVFSKITHGLTDDDAGPLADKLRELNGDSTDPVYLLVRVGRAVGFSATAAIKSLGEIKDLDGTYEIVADSGRKELTVKAATKRSVQIQ